MWFLYVNGAYICKSKDVILIMSVVRALMFCEGINAIELRPELEF